MWSKKSAEINNPPMKKGEIMIVSDNEEKRGYDKHYVKIATADGNFNDFDYGVSVGGSGGSGGSNVITLYGSNVNTSAGVDYYLLYKDMQCSNAVTKEEIINCISNNFLIRILNINGDGVNYWQNLSGFYIPNVGCGLYGTSTLDGTNITTALFFDAESYELFAG